MNQYLIIFLSLTCLVSCKNIQESVGPLQSVDVCYQAEAPWGRLRFVTYGKDSLILKDGPRFRIEDADSLKHINRLYLESHLDTSRNEAYEDAVIAAFLHYADRTDTLVSNARPSFRMDCNSRPLYNDGLIMCLIDAVVSRDSGWKEDYDSLYYDNDFHYLSHCGCSRDQWAAESNHKSVTIVYDSAP